MSTAFNESMEAIAFQIGNRLLPVLAQAFENIMAAKDDRPRVEQELMLITQTTLEYTGILMVASWVKSYKFILPYRLETESVNLNAIHPLNDKAVKKLSGYDLEGINIYETVNGAIDIRTGRVSGFFSELRNLFMVSESMFDGTFTGKEIAALYLHEVGHAWVLYRYLCETLITNVILAEVIGRIDSEDTIEKKVLLGTAALRFAQVNKEVDMSVAKSADITALVMEGQTTRLQKQSGSRWYDKRLAEAMSDQFAARWMAGAALVTAMAKMERKKLFVLSTSGFDSPWIGIAANITNIAMIPFGLVTAGARVFTTKLLMKFAKSFLFGVTMSSAASIIFNTKRYDSPQQRFNAMRRELVTLLKDRELDSDTRKQALADIKVIDEELASIHSYGDVMGKLTSYTIDVVTGREQQLQRHHTVEELANNRFYEVSALLKG